jgi:hypothetical protein
MPNKLRLLLLSSMAYCLREAIRSVALKDTELARGCCDTIRLRLLKIGTVNTRNTRRVKFCLCSSYPLQSLFMQVFKRLAVG